MTVEFLGELLLSWFSFHSVEELVHNISRVVLTAHPCLCCWVSTNSFILELKMWEDMCQRTMSENCSILETVILPWGPKVFAASFKNVRFLRNWRVCRGLTLPRDVLSRRSLLFAVYTATTAPMYNLHSLLAYFCCDTIHSCMITMLICRYIIVSWSVLDSKSFRVYVLPLILFVLPLYVSRALRRSGSKWNGNGIWSSLQALIFIMNWFQVWAR